MDLTPAVLAASTARSIGLVIALLAVVGFVVYALVNIRAGRDEVGSEIELAPNRKPYYSDEELEGRKLDRTLGFGIVTLGIIAVGLPLYWLNEPGRQDDAEVEFNRIFASRGEELFATTAEGGFNCAGCHGPEGVGGAAPYTITDEDGEFVATVNWQAPALNTVLSRYSREEVEYIIVYGRPFSPMPPWGVEGGGAMNEQQVQNLIDYLASIQLTPEEARAEIEGNLRSTLGLEEGEEIDYSDPEVGEALFNLGRSDGFAGGAYSCGRCHTRGWSLQLNTAQPDDADLGPYADYPDGAGAFGPSLRYQLVPRQFLTIEEMVEFITLGSEDGIQYGRNGQGSGRMPGFGDNPNTEDVEGDGMMTEEMIHAIACYEATLSGETERASLEGCA